MRRIYAPAVIGLTGLLSITSACDLEYEETGVSVSNIRVQPSTGNDDPEPPPIRQSSDLRGPTSYLYTPTSGVRWRMPWGSAQVYDLDIDSGQVTGTALTWGGETTIAGKDFKGSTFDMVFRLGYTQQQEGIPAVRQYEVTDVKTLSELASQSESGLAKLPLHTSVIPSELHVYKLETNKDYDRDGTPDGTLCQVPHYDRDNPIWQYAVAVPVDWDRRGKASATARTGRFTFACLNSAAAKCRLWGYELKPDTYGYGYVKKSLWAVNACTRMVMADYCGSGFSYTIDGTEIDFADNQRVNSVYYYGHDRAGQKPEALWGKDGVYCMSDYRIKNSTRAVVKDGVVVRRYGWHNGKPVGLMLEGDGPRGPDVFCGGETPYHHEVRACTKDDIENATLPHGTLGYNVWEDVVISNSSEADYWIVVNTAREHADQLEGFPTSPPPEEDPAPTPSFPTVPSLPPVFGLPALP